MADIINSESLFELHKQLDEFAKKHQNIGVGKAIEAIKIEWEKDKKASRDGTSEGKLFSSGYDQAMKEVIYLLSKSLKL